MISVSPKTIHEVVLRRLRNIGIYVLHCEKDCDITWRPYHPSLHLSFPSQPKLIKLRHAKWRRKASNVWLSVWNVHKSGVPFMRSHWFSDGFLHKELFSHPVLQDLRCMNHEVRSLNRWWLVDRSKKKSVTTCHMGTIWSSLATTLPSIVETDGVRAVTHWQFTPGRMVCATPWMKHGVAAILEHV